MNTPVVFVADFNDPTGSTVEQTWQWQAGTRQLVILASDNTQRWLYTWITTMEIDWSGEWDWQELSPASAESVVDGTVATIQVKPGDVVSFWSSSGIVPHGLVLSDYNGGWATAAEAIDFFFDPINATGTWMLTEEDRFLNFYGHPGWASEPSYGGHFYSAAVRDNAAGTNLFFTDLIWGPYAMNGVLEVVGENM